MKTKLLLLLSVSFLIISCSSDDSGSDDNGNPATSLPINSGNYWTYDVLNHATPDAPETWTRDSLYVANDTVINTITYKKMKTLMASTGFFSGTLRNNGLLIDGNKMKITGSVDFSVGLPTSLAFSVSEFIILKEGANAGESLSSTSGSFDQTISGYPLTFTYTLRSEANGSQSSFTSDGVTYNDITKTKVILNLKITTTVSGFSLTVMNAQDVLVSNQYYSKNIGMVYNHTYINYSLNSIPNGPTLPFPSSGNQTQEEFLDVYQTN